MKEKFNAFLLSFRGEMLILLKRRPKHKLRSSVFNDLKRIIGALLYLPAGPAIVF